MMTNSSSVKKATKYSMLPKISTFSTPDQVLNAFGAKNYYILWIWISMGFLWMFGALAMMISVFIMDEICVPNADSITQCQPEDGSISKEFKLTGLSAGLVDISTTAYLLGVTIGSPILSILSDRKGRRLIILISMALSGLSGCFAAIVPNIYLFSALRFVQGIFFSGLAITSWVLAYESIPSILRAYTPMVFGLFWVLGYCLDGALASFMPTWRYLMIATSLPSLLCAIIYYFLVPESFHYLVANMQASKIEKWIDNANSQSKTKNLIKFDANELCKKISLTILEVKLEQKTGAINYIKQNKILILYMLVIAYLWTCDIFIYYGLSLFSQDFMGNRYANFILMGLIEIPSYALSPYLLNKLGRRLYVSLLHFLAAAAFFLIIASNNPMISLGIWLIGKFAIASALTSLFVYASEVFPTVTRTGCIGVCSFVARAIGTLTPVIKPLTEFHPLAPTIFFGLIAGLAGILTCLLPETANKELPQATATTTRKQSNTLDA